VEASRADPHLERVVGYISLARRPAVYELAPPLGGFVAAVVLVPDRWLRMVERGGMQPEDEQAAVVVGVRDASLRQAQVGLVLSLCLVVALAASHPSRRMIGTFGLLQSVTGAYAGLRAAFKFRGRLDKAESLPTEAVEAVGRPERPPVGWKQPLVGAAVLVAALGALIVFDWHEWAPEVVAAVIAGLIADGLVRPLATAYFVARWERAHGRARLFSSLARDEEGKDTLYVTDRPVPAA
jgi:hypothetical protein